MLIEKFWEMDTAIIAIGFGQIVKWGELEDNYKPFMKFALEREYKPIKDPSTGKNRIHSESKSIFTRFMQVVEKA